MVGDIGDIEGTGLPVDSVRLERWNRDYLDRRDCKDRSDHCE